MQGFIDALQSWVDDAEVERSELYNLSNSWDEEPVEGVEELLSISTPYALGYAPVGSGSAFAAFGGRPASMADAINTLQRLVNDLQTRLDEAIAMNDSGITFSAEEGVVCYYLPDGVEDTPENVKTYNSQSIADAKADATALEQALASKDGTAEDGRTVEEIAEAMAKKQDIDIYGAAFVNTVGVDTFLDMVQQVQADNTYSTASSGTSQYAHPKAEDEAATDSVVNTMGHILAAASHQSVTGPGLAAALETAVTEDGHKGRTAAMNALLSVEGLHYNAGFLVDLADRMEELPYDGTRPTYPMPANKVDDYGPVYTRASLDPLEGVLTAMGTNTEAALEYLAPEDGGAVDAAGNWVPSQASADRWELLTNRTWDPDKGSEALTTAMAGASAQRMPSDDSTDERAAWATGEAMTYLSGLDEDAFTQTGRDNVAIILGNSMADIEDVINGNADSSGAVFVGDATRPAVLPGNHESDIRALTRLVGMEESSLSILSNAVGRYSTARNQAILDEYPDATLGDGSGMDEAFKTASRNDGALLGFIEQSAVSALTGHGESEAHANELAASTVLGAFGAGLSVVPHPAAQAASVVVTAATPGLTEQMSQFDLTQVEDAEDLSDAAQQEAFQAAMAQISNAGRLPDAAYIDYNGKDLGDLYDWMDDDHQIDLTMLLSDSTYRKQFNHWMESPDVPSSDLEIQFGAGIGHGHDKVAD
ncbi:DUF6571 family protein [Actinomyces ruminis]|uniref:DUF6571 family protein n=1 Tax=Actinomyces ruminis TaxID=1937003 RepID=UPI0011787424|nr:DUF6571 family protein [Actinomyces ruminis]